MVIDTAADIVLAVADRLATAAPKPETSNRLTRPRPARCDPRSPRRATATGDGDPPVHGVVVVAILGHPGGRPPPTRGRHGPVGGTCCDPRSPRRATATPSGQPGRLPIWRYDPWSPRRATAPYTALKLRPDHCCCDPRSPRRATATLNLNIGAVGTTKLRSSVTPEGDRHPERWSRRPGCDQSCDPRSPRRATATISWAGRC